MKKIKLNGFNNLTKNLNFCIYNICYTYPKKNKIKYINYIDEKYKSINLIKVLKEICIIIGAEILNIAKQDYDPQGASATLLISEKKNNNILKNKKILSHLNKSHICIHTYPEIHPKKEICTCRLDIEISTCGLISPLKALNFIINKFKSDIVTIDYKIRGFTRDKEGKKYFTDHKINSIQKYIEKDIKKIYDMIDVNIYQENIFHTKMIVKYFKLKKYLFNINEKIFNSKKKKNITYIIWKEMQEIYYGKNI